MSATNYVCLNSITLLVKTGRLHSRVCTLPSYTPYCGIDNNDNHNPTYLPVGCKIIQSPIYMTKLCHNQNNCRHTTTNFLSPLYTMCDITMDVQVIQTISVIHLDSCQLPEEEWLFQVSHN